MDLMIDIETLGTTPGSAVFMIAAAEFNPLTGHVHRTLVIPISVAESMMAGFTTDPETLEWWATQDPEVRSKQMSGTKTPEEAFNELREFISEIDPDRVWAKSPIFDFLILKHSFEAVGVEWPVSFRQYADVRTIVDHGRRLMNFSRPSHTTNHEALEDCLQQISQVSDFFMALTP